MKYKNQIQIQKKRRSNLCILCVSFFPYNGPWICRQVRFSGEDSWCHYQDKTNWKINTKKYKYKSNFTIWEGIRIWTGFFFFRDTYLTMARHKYVFTCWFVITITMWTVDFKKRITETSRINNSDLRKGGIGPTIRSSEKWIRIIIKSMCAVKRPKLGWWRYWEQAWWQVCEQGWWPYMRSRTRRWQDFEWGWWQRCERGWWQYEVDNKKMARLWARMMTRMMTMRW